MIAFGKDDSLREGWVDGKNGMIPAGLDGKGLAQRRRGAKKRLKNVRMINTEVRKQGKGFGNLRFHSTFDLIEAAEKGLLPNKIMLNTHPQRWTDNPLPWIKELVWQNVKNVVKRIKVLRFKF